MSANKEIGTWAPVGVGTRTRKLIEVAPEIAGVAHTDRIAFTTFHGHCDRVPSDGALDDLIHILDLKTVSGRGLSVHGEVQKITSGSSLSESASCVWKIGEGLFDLNCNVLDSLEIRAEDLDTQHRPESGCQHLGAGLDRHPEDLGHARSPTRLVHLFDQLIPSRPSRPLLRRFQLDNGFKHREWSRIG